MARWQELTKEVRKLVDHESEYYSYMSVYEKSAIEGQIAKLQQQYGQAVVNGALSEWNQAKRFVLDAQKNIEIEKQAERRRWDDSKLSASLQSVKALVDASYSAAAGNMDEAAKRLQNVYQDYYGSGDLHKQRAAVEIFGGLKAGKDIPVEDGMKINTLAQQAQRDAPSLRSTPGLEKAHKTMENAVNGLDQARQTIVQADIDMGWTRPNGEMGQYPFAKAVASAKQDRATGFFTFEE